MVSEWGIRSRRKLGLCPPAVPEAENLGPVHTAAVAGAGSRRRTSETGPCPLGLPFLCRQAEGERPTDETAPGNQGAKETSRGCTEGCWAGRLGAKFIL